VAGWPLTFGVSIRQDRAVRADGTFRRRRVGVLPKCVRQPHVPIWVGGSSEASLARVAAFGEVWHPTGFGDLVAWDNTGLLHRVQPYDAASRRLLHRTTRRRARRRLTLARPLATRRTRRPTRS
jgi:alkanesulfonate monooxygenase SsuD/methylene tetrahydromethanopterin reductase-like flavin-dependent oxidoreductase (luciferase family)